MSNQKISPSAQSARERHRDSATGRFGNQRARESEVDLDTTDRPPHLARLDAVLATYDTDILADNPDLEQAWSDRFAVLDGDVPVDEATYITRMMGDPDWGRHRGGPWLEVVDADDVMAEGRSLEPGDTVGDDELLVARVHTRNGSGNREHYHDGPQDQAEDGCTACATDRLTEHPLYLADADNGFDPTYADFVFRIPGSEREAVLAAMNNRDAARTVSALKSELASIEAGETGPWAVQARPAEHRRLADETRRARSAVLSDWARERHEKTVADTSRALDVLEGRDAAEPAWSDTARTPGQPLRLLHVRDRGQKYRDAADHAQALAKVRAEVEAAGSPALTDYMFGERESRSVQTVELRGRAKRVVTRSYTPKSPFLEDEERAARDLARAQADYTETRELLTAGRDEAQAALDRGAQADSDLAALTDQAWSLGWQGDPARIPPRPAPQVDPWDWS